MNERCSQNFKTKLTRLSTFLLCALFLSVATAQDEQAVAEYRLEAGDVMQIRVYGEDDLTMTLSIPGNGRIDYAFVGEFQVAGKTVNAVQEEFYQRLLGDYLIEPRVSVSVASYRDFYIYGAVARPGGYAWEPGLTVRKVITLAGGLKERASNSKWYLVPENAGEGQRRKVSEDDLVQPGDTLTVEESFF